MAKNDSDDLAKLIYVEDQVTQLLKFRFECYDLLTKEAHITLNWLFGLIIASAGYSFKIVQSPYWYLVIPLLMGAAFAANEAWKLIRHALTAKKVPSMGNEPDELATENALSRTQYELRLDHLKTFQGRVDCLHQLNLKKGDAINRARKAVLLIPLAATGLATILVITALLLAWFPFYYHL